MRKETPGRLATDVADETAAIGENPSSITERYFRVDEFSPRRFLRNGHVQTIAGNFLPRPNRLPSPEEVLVEVSPALNSQIASHVLCHCHWHPEESRRARPTVILLHGLEGSSDSQYIIGNSNKLWQAGANVIRMNMRNCGGTERLTPTLYHSGLSQDVAAAMFHFCSREQLTRVALVGYSMGGNLVLKLAGELGSEPFAPLRAVVGVSPAMDMGPSADELHRPHNRIYERKFLRAMLKRYRRKVRFFPRAYDPNKAVGIKSLREFDERITALYTGHLSADDYYYRVSAARVLDRITVPTLILHAADDPFVILTPETRAIINDNPHITFVETKHGGHCAFLAEPDTATKDDGYWAEKTLLRFILAHA